LQRLAQVRNVGVETRDDRRKLDALVEELANRAEVRTGGGDVALGCLFQLSKKVVVWRALARARLGSYRRR
jgi:hypothetical protein